METKNSKKTLTILLVAILCISKASERWQKSKYKDYIKVPVGYPHKYQGRVAGYPAPPNGKWPYHAKVHPYSAASEYGYYGSQGSSGLNGHSNAISPLLMSPNDVLGDGFSDESDWDFPLDEKICFKLPGLTRAQLHLCHKYTDVTAAAAIGLRLAVGECRNQLKGERWNCTSLESHSDNPHSAPIMERGYSETAFIHAITAAGVTHSVARACAAGKLTSCSCGMVKGKQSWKWAGCHDNTKFGARFSRLFLDIREKARDILSFTHLFNNEVGRKIVRRNRQVHCKCHGMSGSCEVRTCWKAVPSFRKVGAILAKKYRGAKSASHEIFGNSADKMKHFKPIRREITLDSPLLYAERSPTFCSADKRLGVQGTSGRACNKTSTGQDSCDAMCCGRGYNITRRKVVRKCHCVFKWCCHVTCKDCTIEEWITVCK